MRTLAALSIITATFFFSMMPAKVEAQCLLCGVVGFTLGSTSNDERAGVSPGNVIYVAPHIGERIDDPLAVRVAATPRMRFSNKELRLTKHFTKGQNMTLREMFELAVPNYEKFTILEIVRVINPSENQLAVFWFSYIENEKMRPLSELPSN